MCAVVVRFDCIAFRIMGVCVEGVEVSAYPLDWGEVLIRSAESLYNRVDQLT
jgi:hypothetical protein